MSFVRTVLGDIDAGELGVTDAHEHLIISGGKPVEMSADFLLADVDKAVAELRGARSLGLRSVVDAMPIGCGRDALALAEVSRRSQVNVVAPTGLHHERFYDRDHWSERAPADDIAEMFVADVNGGIDAHDHAGPTIERTQVRAGVIKVGGSGEFPTERDERVFAAAAIAHGRTGVPILTHCEEGRFGIEQIETLVRHGADPSHVALSHVDKVVDRAYHRDLAASGARLEYDQAFRWGDAANGTLQLIDWMIEDGLTDHLLLGLDAARQGYWQVYGGRPGLAYLVKDLPAQLDARGVSERDRSRMYIDNPAATFAFAAAEEAP